MQKNVFKIPHLGAREKKVDEDEPQISECAHEI